MEHGSEITGQKFISDHLQNFKALGIDLNKSLNNNVLNFLIKRNSRCKLKNCGDIKPINIRVLSVYKRA